MFFIKMKKTVSIKENKDFKRLYYRGKSASQDCLVLYWRRTGAPGCRLGITVSSKVGKAVVRNRVRRLIKESYRLMEDRIPRGYDFVVVARSRAAEADFHRVSQALEKVMTKGGVVKEGMRL